MASDPFLWLEKADAPDVIADDWDCDSDRPCTIFCSSLLMSIFFDGVSAATLLRKNTFVLQYDNMIRV
jgi:hypothetical protein